jgi:CBS domain-containing protein
MEPPVDAASGLPAASELASTPVVAVRGALDAMDALREMYRHGVHHLAVLPADSAGLVNAVDLLFGIATRLPGESAPVEGLCHRPAPTVRADDSGGLAAQRMIEARSDAVLVTDGEAVRGVLTAVDLVRAVAERAPSEQRGT